MLENIVVDCSPLTGTLRIGRVGKGKRHLLEWEEREHEILEATRDFLVAKAEKEKGNTYGYEWIRKDGKTVELRVSITDKGYVPNREEAEKALKNMKGE